MSQKENNIQTWLAPSLGKASPSVDPKVALKQVQEQAEKLGYEEGLKKAQLEISQKKAELDRLIAAFTPIDRRVNDALQLILEDYCYHVLTYVLKQEVLESKNLIANLVKEGLSLLKSHTWVEIHVSPAVMSAQGEMLSNMKHLSNVRMVENPHLNDLDIQLKTDEQMMICELGKRLKAMIFQAPTSESTSDNGQSKQYDIMIQKRAQGQS